MCVCVCVCVFEIYVLKIIVRRWFWEFKFLFGSLLKLHAWLHLCLCFSLLKKLFLKASSTPGYLLSFQAFSYRNLDTSSTPHGLIEPHLLCLKFCTSTFSRHLYLLMAKSSTPLDTFIHRALLKFYIYFLMRSKPHFSRSLSLNTFIFSPPKPLSLTPNLFLKGFSSFFKSFFTW